MQAVIEQPAGVGRAPRDHVVHGDSLAQGHGEPNAAAGEEAPGPGKRDVGRHEICARDAVAVGEDQVVARRGLNSPVENLALAKAPVLVPDVMDVEPRLGAEPTDQKRGLLSRAVVGHEQVKLAMALHRIAPKDLFQPLGGVVGAQDHGHPHRRRPSK